MNHLHKTAWLLGALALAACGVTPAAIGEAGIIPGDGNSGDGDLGGGGGDGDFGTGLPGDTGDGDVDIDTGCGEIEKTAEVEGGPVDIILVLDSSLSMAQGICNVSTNLTAFAASVGDNTHVVALYDMGILGVAAFGACGSADPLADTPLAKDPKRYQHVVAAVDSSDGLTVVVNNFDKYKGFLRANAATHVIMLSDDNASFPFLLADGFKSQMESKLGHKFYYHAIVNDGSCVQVLGGVGTEHINLAKATGGKTLKICSTDFAQLFKELEAAVVATVPLPCDFEIPVPPQGQEVDVENGVRVLFTPPGSSRAEFPRATDNAQCGDELGWFANAEQTRIEFCPTACELVKDGGALSIGFGCGAILLQ